MPPPSTIVGELDQNLAKVLPTLTEASDQLLLASSRSLQTPTGWPSWLLLSNVRIGCRCQVLGDSKTNFFWIFNSPASARELLTAQISFELSPIPHDFTRAGSNDTTPSLRLPAPLVAAPSDDELSRLLPPKSDPLRSLLLQIGPDEFYAFGVATGADLGPTQISARWTRGATVIDQLAGEGVEWQLEPFLRVAIALSASPPYPSETNLPFPELLPFSPLWDFYREVIATAGKASAALDEGWARPPTLPLPEELKELRTRWSLTTLTADVNPLLKIDEKTGDVVLARVDDDDSFTAPFAFVLNRMGQRSLDLRLPDFVSHGPVRQVLLDAFSGLLKDEDGEPRFSDAYKALEEVADRAGVPAQIVRSWIEKDAAQAAVLRIDRRATNDEMMLLIEGEYAGRRVGLFIWVDKVAWDENGQLANISRIKSPVGGDIGSIAVSYREGKMAFCDFLHGLLRWRGALRL